MSKSIRGAALAGVAVTALALSIAACGSGSGKGASDAQSGKADLHAVASNSQVQQDEKNIEANVVAPCVAKATGLHPIRAFEACVEDKIPASDRARAKGCLVKAAGDDNVLTRSGRKTFETVSANQCIAPYISASASASPSPVGTPGAATPSTAASK